jgi:hypothetical protein
MMHGPTNIKKKFYNTGFYNEIKEIEASGKVAILVLN